MNEVTWQTCPDLQKMLEFLDGRAGARKLRLFAAADCRLLASLPEGESRRGLEALERHADGLAGPEEAEAARTAALTEMKALGKLLQDRQDRRPESWLPVLALAGLAAALRPDGAQLAD